MIIITHDCYFLPNIKCCIDNTLSFMKCNVRQNYLFYDSHVILYELNMFLIIVLTEQCLLNTCTEFKVLNAIITFAKFFFFRRYDQYSMLQPTDVSCHCVTDDIFLYKPCRKKCFFHLKSS